MHVIRSSVRVAAILLLCGALSRAAWELMQLGWHAVGLVLR